MMSKKILDNSELDLKDLQTLIKKKGKSIDINKLSVRKNHLVAHRSELIKVMIRDKNGKLSISSGFPAIGNSVQMASSFIFIIIFFFARVPFFVVFAIILGQIFSLLYYYPKSLQLKKDIYNLMRGEQ